MVIGNKEYFLGSKIIKKEPCPSCQENKCLVINSYQNVFWFAFPCFPTEKFALIRCNNCKKVYHPYEMPKNFHLTIDIALRSYKVKFWMFLLPIIFIAAAIFTWVTHKTPEDYKAMFPNLKKGSIITVEDNQGYISRMHLDSIFNADYYFTESIYFEDKHTPLPNINDEDFSGDHIKITPQQLEYINNQTKITDIKL